MKPLEKLIKTFPEFRQKIFESRIDDAEVERLGSTLYTFLEKQREIRNQELVDYKAQMELEEDFYTEWPNFGGRPAVVNLCSIEKNEDNR